jgi:hypothetical protein
LRAVRADARRLRCRGRNRVRSDAQQRIVMTRAVAKKHIKRLCSVALAIDDNPPHGIAGVRHENVHENVHRRALMVRCYQQLQLARPCSWKRHALHVFVV